MRCEAEACWACMQPEAVLMHVQEDEKEQEAMRWPCITAREQLRAVAMLHDRGHLV